MPGLSAREYLRNCIIAEDLELFGIPNSQQLDSVVNAWMNDAGNSAWRYEEINYYAPGSKRILDLASGCGTFVFYGLANGYDVYGIEPSSWKNRFNQLKAREFGYPLDWCSRFVAAVGESLPFRDCFFDCVSSYQTLEHVQSPEAVVSEMVRVTRPGGKVLLRFPDYRSTFEGHYLLPWLPMFPRRLAKIYLRGLNRPTIGLDTLKYTTVGRVKSWSKSASKKLGCHVTVWEQGRKARMKALIDPKLVFRREAQIHLVLQRDDSGPLRTSSASDR
jgi:SAM-dependent methyltransferase